jgi:ABC-2 type transport system ATP-binding protein
MGLKLENVKKTYGEKTVVDGISLELKEPGVYGLLGTNGARKNNHH